MASSCAGQRDQSKPPIPALSPWPRVTRAVVCPPHRAPEEEAGGRAARSSSPAGRSPGTPRGSPAHRRSCPSSAEGPGGLSGGIPGDGGHRGPPPSTTTQGQSNWKSHQDGGHWPCGHQPGDPLLTAVAPRGHLTHNYLPPQPRPAQPPPAPRGHHPHGHQPCGHLHNTEEPHRDHPGSALWAHPSPRGSPGPLWPPAQWPPAP